MTRRWRLLAAPARLAMVAVAFVSSPADLHAQAPRSIPGLTARDAFPNGCLDCHVAGKDGDMRLSVAVAKWVTAAPPALVERAKAASADPAKIKGKHPAVPNAKANIPHSCATCHRKGSTTAPPFALLLHTIHLAGSPNRFLGVNQGECTYCHKLDQKTGAWTLPTGAEK